FSVLTAAAAEPLELPIALAADVEVAHPLSELRTAS
ncbi:MAG: hypothetical protein QOC86_954, partial [Gaiellales bacterium]|nr:hypothetical protein [Gaiellales bacterium]